MGEGHENAKYRLIVQALYGLFSVQVQTVNCLKQAVAAVSVPGILKMGSDTNTVWLLVVLLLLSHEISYFFFPCWIPKGYCSDCWSSVKVQRAE